MGKPFADTWKRLREKAGYQSPWHFYKSNGGHKALKLSFGNFWKMEQGKQLPKPDRLPVLASCLRGAASSKDIQDLAAAYLKDWLGQSQVSEWFLTRLNMRSPGRPLAQEAAQQLTYGRAAHLTVPQCKAIISSYAVYCVWLELSGSKESGEIKTMAKRLGLQPAQVVRAAKALAAHKLAIYKNNTVMSPFLGKTIFYPTSAVMKEFPEKSRQFQQELIKKQGSIKKRCHLVLRAMDSNMEEYEPHLLDAVRNASIYKSQDGKGPIYIVEGTIYRATRA